MIPERSGRARAPLFRLRLFALVSRRQEPTAGWAARGHQKPGFATPGAAYPFETSRLSGLGRLLWSRFSALSGGEFRNEINAPLAAEGGWRTVDQVR